MMLVREITAGLVLLGVFVGSPVQLQAEPRRRSKYEYHDLASSNKSKGRKSLRGHKAFNDFPGKCRPLRTRKNNGLILLQDRVYRVFDCGQRLRPTLGD